MKLQRETQLHRLHYKGKQLHRLRYKGKHRHTGYVTKGNTGYFTEGNTGTPGYVTEGNTGTLATLQRKTLAHWLRYKGKQWLTGYVTEGNTGTLVTLQRGTQAHWLCLRATGVFLSDLNGRSAAINGLPFAHKVALGTVCLLYTSPSPRDFG